MNESGEIRLSDVVRLVQGELHNETEDFVISGLAALDRAGPNQISFLTNPKYQKMLSETTAGAVLMAGKIPENHSGPALILVKDAYLALARLLQRFHPPVLPEKGIQDSASIHPTATIGKDVTVSHNVVISAGASIGDRTILFPGVYVGKDASIGNDGLIYSNVSIYHTVTIGDHVIIHSGAVIGSDGFGFAKDGPVYVKMPQIGSVIVKDHVEIGANCTIDRGSMGMTILGQGVKLDNMIHLAHNVQIGENTAMAAQTGVSGSTSIGKRNMVGGQVGMAGHITIGDDVIVTAKAGVMKSVTDGQMISGFPQTTHRRWRKNQNALRHGTEMRSDIRKLQKEIVRLNDKINNLTDKEGK